MQHTHTHLFLFVMFCFPEWSNDYRAFVNDVQLTFIYTRCFDLRGRGCTQRLPGTGNLRSNPKQPDDQLSELNLNGRCKAWFGLGPRQ